MAVKQRCFYLTPTSRTERGMERPLSDHGLPDQWLSITDTWRPREPGSHSEQPELHHSPAHMGQAEKEQGRGTGGEGYSLTLLIPLAA